MNIADFIVTLDRQVFISKSGSFPDTARWKEMFSQAFGDRFNLICDDDFRPVYDIAIGGRVDAWSSQFEFTRRSYAVIALLDPAQWTSWGQYLEIDDAFGRGIPVAFCRVVPFVNENTNSSFKYMASGEGDAIAPVSFFEYFDFVERDIEQELKRLERWISEFATAPLSLPQYFTAGRPQVVQTTVRVPRRNGWSALDDTCLPLLVFNYGQLLVHMQDRLPSTWMCKATNQIVLPLERGTERGELRAEVTLPREGFGHVVVTVGQPKPNYAREEGGIAERTPETFLWWDFWVSTPQ